MMELTKLVYECPFCSNFMIKGPQLITTISGVAVTTYSLRCRYCGAVASYSKSASDRRIDKYKVDFTLEPEEQTILRRACFPK